jgi:hypothetical protein
VGSGWKFMYKGVDGAESRARAAAWDVGSIRGEKSKYVPTRAGTHRLGHPGRSEFPVPVQSLTGSGVPGRGAERRDWVAEVGVLASKGFQG